MSGKAITGIKMRMAETREAAGDYAQDYKQKAEQALQEWPSKRQLQYEATDRASTVLSKAERAPDTLYLGAMAASMALSLLLLGRKNKAMALFVGLWPVTIVNIALMLKNRRPSRELEGATPVSAGVDGPLLAE